MPGKRSYDFNTEPATVSGNEGYRYDNPTFSYEDRTRHAEQSADAAPPPSYIDVTQPHGYVTQPATGQPQREMAKFPEIHNSRIDYLKFAFLVTFPLVFFIVAVVITSQNV